MLLLLVVLLDRCAYCIVVCFWRWRCWWWLLRNAVTDIVLLSLLHRGAVGLTYLSVILMFLAVMLVVLLLLLLLLRIYLVAYHKNIRTIKVSRSTTFLTHFLEECKKQWWNTTLTQQGSDCQNGATTKDTKSRHIDQVSFGVAPPKATRLIANLANIPTQGSCGQPVETQAGELHDP